MAPKGNSATSYPKGDLRRLASVLAAIDEAGDASLVQLAARTGLAKQTVIEPIIKASD